MSRKHAALLCIISLSPSKVKQSASSCICVEECCVLLQLMNRLRFKATRAVTENHVLRRVDVGEAIIKASILEVTPILICHLRNSAGITLNDLRRGYFPSEHSELNQKHDTTQLIGLSDRPPTRWRSSGVSALWREGKNTPPRALFNQPLSRRSQTPM